MSVYPTTKIEIDGKVYIMKPTFDFISRIEVIIGQSYMQIVMDKAANFNLTLNDIYSIVNEGIKASDGDIDEQELKEFIVLNQSYCWEALTEFFRKSFGGEETEGRNKGQKKN